MKLVISDPKTGKAYSTKVDEPSYFFDKKVGDKVALDLVGLDNFEAQITGGSDTEGFPMRRFVTGAKRSKVFMTMNKKEGLRIRLNQRGNTISKDIAQLNLKIVKNGTKKIDEVIIMAVKEKKKSAKDELIEASLKTSGTAEAAKEMAREGFKKGENK